MIVELDVAELGSHEIHPVFERLLGCLVVMPATDMASARRAAEMILKRAGAECSLLIVNDNLSWGFIKIVNAAANKYQGEYLLYCAQDAFPGMDFLKRALGHLKKNKTIHLLAFNDGKWFGRIASFGLVRLSWTRALYGSGVFCSLYKSHGADVELSEIAKKQNCLGFDSLALLVEVDFKKGRRWQSNQDDMALLAKRREQGFVALDAATTPRAVGENTNKHSLKRYDASRTRVVVYTCNFGDYEAIKEPKFKSDDVQYLLFTDQTNVTSRHWTVSPLKVNRPLNARRFSRLPKILSHKLLPAHDISVYLDSSLTLNTPDIRELALALLGDRDIALYRHFQRRCIYEEIEHCRTLGLERPQVCDAAIKYLASINFPKNVGLFENAFIVRKNTPTIVTLNELWWTLYTKGSQRDQFSLMPALQQTGVTVNPIELGEQFRTSPFLIWEKHKQSYQPEETSLKRQALRSPLSS